MYALSDDSLRQTAPSIFAEHPAPGASARYGFVPTIDVVNALRTEGWLPVHAAQTRARYLERVPFARHVVRFRRLQDPIEVGDGLAELVLTNSHDRSAAYALDVGLFRLLCLNGLVVSTGGFGAVRIRHGRRVVEDVLDASYEIIDHVPQVAASVDRLQSVALEPAEQRLFAQSALAARYGERWQKASPVPPDALLTARRPDDQGSDLWRTFNTVQENLMRGGLAGRSSSGRRIRTRGVRSVAEDVRLNKALWLLAEGMAELKGQQANG